MTEDLLKSVKDHLEGAKHCHEMLQKSMGNPDHIKKWRTQRDHHVKEGMRKLSSLIPELKKAQYAKTGPVEERKAEKNAKKQEEKAGKKFGEMLRRKAENMMRQKSGANPGKGVSTESPKKSLRSVNKVNAGDQVNPRKDGK